MAIYPEYTGDNLQYIYDRDNSARKINLGITPYFSFVPSYDSSVSFECKVAKTKYRDNFQIITPISLNNVKANFDLNFNDITNGQANALIREIEKKMALTGTQEGTLTLDSAAIGSYNERINLNSTIYPVLSGIFIKNYSLGSKENSLNDLKIELESNLYSPFINYKGIFVNESNIQIWDTGMDFVKHDIVYYPVFEDKKNNFFYCLSGHNGSTFAQAPNQNAEVWTQSMYFAPDYSMSFANDYNNEYISTEKSFTERIKINKNSNAIRLSLEFMNRSDKETAAIIHFLENKMGYKYFDLQISGIYRTKKVFSASKWDHTFNYYNSNTVKVEIEENVQGTMYRELAVENYWNIPS